MARTDHYDRVVVFALEQLVRIGRDLAGVDVSGVRRDQRDDLTVDITGGCMVQIVADGILEVRCVSRIPGTRAYGIVYSGYVPCWAAVPEGGSKIRSRTAKNGKNELILGNILDITLLLPACFALDLERGGNPGQVRICP